MDDLDRQLKKLFDLIRDEARQNPSFAERLQATISGGSKGPDGAAPPVHRARRDAAHAPPSPETEAKRGNRRAPALIDPVAAFGDGEAHLRERLSPLDLEQLRDVVAEYRMDPSKLVMKWKDRERVVEHIITTAANRDRKGDAFRS